MDVKLVNLIIFILFSIHFVDIFALPRDSTAVIESDFQKRMETFSKVQSASETKIPGRIWCQHEEATEDVICQEHCLPKGYSYGICVSNTCSCI